MVDLELDQGLAVITINRPNARNAIAPQTMDQLGQAIVGAKGALCLVIRGEGDKAFVSGGDLKELSALRTEEQAAAMAWRMRSLCDELANFPAPVVAALNGHAFGGGAEVAVAADIRVAADDIKIGFNQVSLEIMPAWGGAERLAALVGRGRALMLAGTGAVLTADQAEKVGLVDRVLPRATFETEWRSLARALANRPAGDIKRVMSGVPASDAVAAFASLWVSDEHWAAADRVMKRSR
ncbi:enoyl-CoA hydratase/isomerase family protein [Mycobacterium sp.]|uniref:enoyl-CoA hydratase/isomerase family protein n=1 Tax=Mycobacterium sp. TaxID=1785 RepID=UPI003C7383E7